MTGAERALLTEGPAKLFGWSTGLVSAVCAFLLAFVVASLLVVRLPFDVVIRAAFAVAIAAAGATYIRIQLTHRRRFRDRVDAIHKEAASAQVQSTVYAIRGAIAVEEHEDEGLSYYLLVDDGRTLFLSGQYLYEPAECGFPWESFEVVRVPVSGRVLQIVPLGPSLPLRLTRPPFSARELDSGAIPADGTIEYRDFDALTRVT